MRKITKQFFCAALIGPALVFAQTAPLNCQVSADIYYVNGVNKPVKREVGEAAFFLERKIRNFTKNTSGVKKVTYLYNDSDGLMFDILFELAQQKAAERNSVLSELFVAVGQAAFGLVSTLTDTDKNDVQNAVAGVISSKLSSKTLQLVSDFSLRVATESLSRGIQAILVPHSQGNMFANEVYDGLKLSLPPQLFRGLGVVNIATPTGFAKSNLYLTAYQDLVINLLSRAQSYFGLALQPLRPNFDASVAALDHDISGHGFTEVYLATNLPYRTSPENSIAASTVSLIDRAMTQTSTFYDNPSFIYVNGIKVPKPPGYPASSTSVMVCFPGAVGGL